MKPLNFYHYPDDLGPMITNLSDTWYYYGPN